MQCIAAVQQLTVSCGMSGAGIEGPMSERVVNPAAPRPMPATYPVGALSLLKSTLEPGARGCCGMAGADRDIVPGFGLLPKKSVLLLETS